MKMIAYIRYVKDWIAVRRINKKMIQFAKNADHTPYPPPTTDEVKAFIADIERQGVVFSSRCSKAPPSPPSSHEVIL